MRIAHHPGSNPGTHNRRLNDMKKKLNEIFLVLDNYLGDSDPLILPDDSDEDIKREEPIFWCAKEIQILLQTHDKQPYGEDGRCIHCGAGDDIHHSFTCPTGLHLDSPSSKQPQCICGEINSRNCPVHQ